jgi:hypothetical protein
MAAVAGLYGIGPEDRAHQRRRNQKEVTQQTPDGLSEP